MRTFHDLWMCARGRYANGTRNVSKQITIVAVLLYIAMMVSLVQTIIAVTK